MKTDALSYRLFKELPETFFELIGRPASEVAHYRFAAVEIKDTAVRLDGLYQPVKENFAEPVYFVEYQNRKSAHAYSNILLKIGLYLEKVEPRQEWHAVIIYPTRAAEQDNLGPYRGFLNLDQVTRVYLDQLPEPPGNFGISLLKMLAARPAETLAKAQRLIPQVRASQVPVEIQKKLLQLLETIVFYQFPQMSRKEFEKMLQVNDIRETRIYQEAMEEGEEKAQDKFARRLLAKKYPLEEIAELTGLSLPQLKKLKKKPG